MHLQSFHAEWTQLHSRSPETAILKVQSLVALHKETLASTFYSVMLADADALQFLSHEQVKTRLNASMIYWLQNLFAADAQDQAATIYAHQTKIGEVHARVDIPVSLVLKGARAMKDEFDAQVDSDGSLTTQERLACGRHFRNCIDLVMQCMCQAYASSYTRKTRSGEAYRLFSITENLSTEKEKQKAALLNWESELMYATFLGSTEGTLPCLRESEFGLWFRHKGLHAFQGLPETDAIANAMQTIDDVCIPLLYAEQRKGASGQEQVRELRDHAKNIQFQLADLFARTQELESGKDVLTRLLNRKFLPIVLSREIEFCRQQSRTFAVANIDIDYFKRVNDTHGHEAGDVVIQQVAMVLSNQCRGGDFLFRLGGEEFLAVLVDTDAEKARQFCERMRTAIKQNPIVLPNDVKQHLTVSIGLACYNGHPDYNYLLRHADDALYKAKHQGRDQVCIA